MNKPKKYKHRASNEIFPNTPPMVWQYEKSSSEMPLDEFIKWLNQCKRELKKAKAKRIVMVGHIFDGIEFVTTPVGFKQ